MTSVNTAVRNSLFAVALLLFASSWCAAQRIPDDVLNEQHSLLNLYLKAMQAEKYEEALDYTGRLCKLGERHLQRSPKLIASFFDLHGQALNRFERYQEGVAAFERSLAYYERARDAKPDDVMDVVRRLADARWNLEDYGPAAKQYERVLKHRRTTLGDRHEKTLQTFRDVAMCYFRLKDYVSAEQYYRSGLSGAQAVNPNDPENARWLHNVADCCWNRDDKPSAEKLYRQAHELRTRTLGALHDDTLFSQNELVDALENLDRAADAEKLLQQVVNTCEGQGDNSAGDTAVALLQLADFYQRHGREDELEPVYQRVLSLRETVFGKDDSQLADTLHEIGNIYHNRGKFADAERYHQRGLKIREAASDASPADMAYSQLCTGISLQSIGKFRDAEVLLRKARDLRQKHFGDDTEEVIETTVCLAELYQAMGRYREGEAAAQQALQVQTQLLGDSALPLARALLVIANIHYSEGHYAQAEGAFRRALRIQERHLGADHVDVTFTLDNLANAVQDQGQLKEAESLRLRALKLGQAYYSEDDPSMAHLLNNLGSLHEAKEQWSEAEKVYRQALSIWEKSAGHDPANVAYGLHNVANCETQLGRGQDAEAKHRRALEIREQVYGAQHPIVAASQWYLAKSLLATGKVDEAEQLLDRSIASSLRSQTRTSVLFETLVARGELSWKAGRKREALDDMHRAMDLAEQIRGQSGGGEQERAKHFAQFSAAFETVLGWQVASGDADEAFAAIERSRARSLLDEMNLGGADIGAGKSAREREELATREAQLKERIAKLEEQLAAAASDEERRTLQAELETARGALYEHFRDQRTSSEVYRQLLAVEGDPLRVRQLQRRLRETNGHMLIYFLGAKGSYLLSIGADSTQIHPLVVAAPQANVLGIKPGMLTRETLRMLLTRADGSGVVQQLADPRKIVPIEKLHALWMVLVPTQLQSKLLAKETQRLTIVPDDALTMLPFEALVVATGASPSYLLHASPSITYAPSATVLYNLYDRPAAREYADKPVVTLGDPSYVALKSLKGEPVAGSANSRYGSSGARLAPLPHTAIEANWVAQVFEKAGTGVDKLLKENATEAKLRALLGRRKVVHLACHGLTDQTYGNFFGALAVTPGPDAATNAADDGFLTLAEIYPLDLHGCEVAILSACETNFGPQQEGEGTWAISRGFLVAGSRRVVASNWLVDDQAAASLVSYYCGSLAKAKDAPANYAASLQDAKRWLAKQPKWQHPYYWAAMVLVGPE